MTTTPIILRRAVMSPRHAAILTAVYRAWAAYRVPTVREIEDAAGYFSPCGVHYQLNAFAVSGWVSKQTILSGHYDYFKYTKGPRLAGLDADGWPLELVI